MDCRIVVYSLLTFLSCATVFAQENYHVQSFTESDSLAQNYINSIVQDPQGFLWIGTGKGLSRYDGKTIRNFRKQQGLADNFITASAIDETGVLFVGHLNGKLSSYDGRKFKAIETDSDAKIVGCSADTINGIVWAINQTGAFFALKDGKITKLESTLTRDKVINCVVALGGRILIGTSEGLIEVWTDGVAIQSEKMIEAFDYTNVTAVSRSKMGWYWVTTEDGILYTHQDGTTNVFKTGTPLSNPQFLLEDSQNILWIATKLNGITKIALDKKLSQVVDIELLDKKPSQQSPSILYEDAEGNIWSGSLGEGLLQFIPHQITLFDLAGQTGATEVRAAVEIEKNLYWVGTDTGVWVGSFDETHKVFSWKKHPDKSLSNLNVKRIFRKGKAGNLLWVAGVNAEIYVTDFTVGTVNRLVNGVPVGQLNDVEQDANGNFWLAIEGHGVWQLNAELKVIKPYNTTNGMLHNSISSVCAGRDGIIWFGSLATGLFRLNANQTFEYWTKDNQFPSYSVNDIKQGADGNLWVATDGDGVFQVTSDSIFNYNEGNGLLSAFSKQLLIDSKGDIWVIHRSGISFINTNKSFSIRTFGKLAGIASLADENKVFLEDKLGNIFFSQSSNFVRFNKYLIDLKNASRKPVFTNLRLFYKDENLDQYTSTVQKNGLASTRFPFDQNHLTFDFVAISLRNRDNIFYKHKLAGYETEWSPASQVASATYTNLSPGDYEMQILASENPYSWSGALSSYKFTIEKPYWERWWFYLSEISFLSLFFSITLFISRRAEVAKNHWAIRMMVYTLVFIILEYFLVTVEPLFSQFQNGAPVFQVIINLILALLLLPLEDRIKRIFYKKEVNP